MARPSHGGAAMMLNALFGTPEATEKMDAARTRPPSPASSCATRARADMPPSRKYLMVAPLLLAVACAAAPHFSIEVDPASLRFNMSLGGHVWSGGAQEPRCRHRGRWAALRVSSWAQSEGLYSANLTAEGVPGIAARLSIERLPGGRGAVFRHCAGRHLVGTAAPGGPYVAKEALSTVFPSFSVRRAPPGAGELGFVAWNGQMVGGMANGTRYGVWGRDRLPGGTQAGPVALFAEAEGGGALVLSPIEHVMAVNGVHSVDGRSLDFGVLGSVTEVPADFCIAVAAIPGDTVTGAVKDFGRLIRDRSGKVGEPWNDGGDVGIDFLTYSTDNGAYFYYNHANASSPQAALEAVMQEKDAPWQGILLDSWWYYKGKLGGVTEWVATPTAFPTGLAAFHRAIGGKHIIAHNRWWSADVVYAKDNGGDYDFLIEHTSKRAIPLSQHFWDDLLGNATRWGMRTYEQDWLHNEWETLEATLTNATLATTWLQQMGRAAAALNVSVQVRRALPRASHCPPPSSLRAPHLTSRHSTAWHIRVLRWRVCCRQPSTRSAYPTTTPWT